MKIKPKHIYDVNFRALLDPGVDVYLPRSPASLDLWPVIQWSAVAQWLEYLAVKRENPGSG